MTNGELLPVVIGFLVGSLLGFIHPSTRRWLGPALIAVSGGLVTVAMGEFQLSWAYLLIDVPLVALGASAGFVLMDRMPPIKWPRRY